MCRKRKAERPAGRDPETRRSNSARARFFFVLASSTAGAERGATDDLHPPASKKRFHLSLPTPRMQHRRLGASVPLKRVFALWSEVVDVGLEMQFEDVVLVDVLRVRGDADGVTQQRKAGQGIIVLQGKTERPSPHTFIPRVPQETIFSRCLQEQVLQLKWGLGKLQQPTRSPLRPEMRAEAVCKLWFWHKCPTFHTELRLS